MDAQCLVLRERESSRTQKAVMSHHHTRPLSCRRPYKSSRRGATTSNLHNPRPPTNIVVPSPALLPLLVVLLSWTSLLAPASATQAHGDRPPLHASPVGDQLLWQGSSLHLDTRPPPEVPLLMPPLPDVENLTNILANSNAKRAVTTDPNAPSSDFTIPKPFDAGLYNNFTSGCTNFLSKLRSSDSLNNCHPVSLMLQTSSGFFDAAKSTLRITQTLDATCAANMTQCRRVMDGFAKDLLASTACKTDYANDNPVVLQAYNGLVAYEPVYQSTCLRDSEGKYCYANAVTNLTAPSDVLPYYLPVGQVLPGGSRPTCNKCLQSAMAIFASYAANTTQPLSKTYSTAAQQLVISCGKTYVNVTAAPLKAAASSTTNATLAPTVSLIVMFILFFFSQ